MNEELIARLSRRYLALDIHKHYSVVAGVNFEGKVVVEPVRIEHADLEGWLKKHIQPTDYVVIESTTNAWHIYDLLEPLAEKVLVANPIKVKQIAQARVKTDIRDTLILARLLAANMVPVIWVPPAHVRNLRYLLSQRRHLVGMHTADSEPDAQCGAPSSLEPSQGQTLQREEYADGSRTMHYLTRRNSNLSWT